MLYSFSKNLLIFFLFIIFIFNLVFSIDVRELEGKTEQELYNMLVEEYKKFNDKSAYTIGVYILKNLNIRNKNVIYILNDILIRNIDSSPDKQKIYNTILQNSDYVINNIDYYDSVAYYHKGWVYYKTMDYASAEVNLKKSIDNNPNFVPSLKLLFELYLNKKDFDKALDISQRIISKGYINRDFVILTLKLYLDTDKINQADDLIKKYNYLLDNEEAFYLISILYYKKKEYSKSLNYIEKSLNKYPDNKDYLKLKIKILYHNKDYNQAYQIIKEKFSDINDEEILVIKKDIESINFRKTTIIVISLLLGLSLLVFSIFYYRELQNKKAKISIQNIKKIYQEKVSSKAENLDILINLIYEFFNNYILGYNSQMAIYVSDPKKYNALYSYLNNSSNNLPDAIYVFPKYSGWFDEYANSAAHLVDIQNNSHFYEWFGGKNIVTFKKEKMLFLISSVTKGLIQALFFIKADSDLEEQKIIQILRKHSDLIKEVMEDIANDIISIRFKEAAYLDELTRLYNRRFMYSKLEEEIEKASKTNQKLSIIMCDIDNFKKFNDTYGHQVGDEVLRAVAKVFKSVSRELFDWPFRYGGEEIGIILPNTNTEKAFEIAERIRIEVSSRKFENVPTTITLSLGLATYPDHGKTIDEIIKQADEALYYSKKTGKNKTTIAGVKILQNVNEPDTPKPQNDLKNQIKNTFKIPTFVYNMEQFSEYYNNIKNSYKYVIINIEEYLNDNIENLIMDIYHNLLLIEVIALEIKDNKVFIKILLVERKEEEIQKLISDISTKYNVKPSITTKV